jgi:2'-5' RNA ligase
MNLAVVAYPALAESDRAWVDSIRASHDPQVGLIRPHFTLVFPTQAEPQEVAIHVHAVVADRKPSAITLREARAVRDPRGGGGHVFLVPDEGYPELVGLHGRLHTGLLRDRLRADLPFVPHITVAALPDSDACIALAHALNRDGRLIRGNLACVDLVRIDALTVESLASIPLGRTTST